MNTDRLRTDLDVLAHRAAAPSPDLADGVLRRRRRQSRSRWAAVGAVAAVGTAVVATPALLRAADPGSVAAPALSGYAGELYAAPTRGSLAGDDAVVAQAQAAGWDDGLDDGTPPGPVPAERRVAFVGAVPGDQVWALVLGLDGPGLVAAWFADVDASDGVQLQLAASPYRVDPGAPVALVDIAGTRAPLLVVGVPGDELAVAAHGSTTEPAPEPVYTDLVTADGVGVTELDGPLDPAALPSFARVQEDIVTRTGAAHWFDSRLPLGPQTRVDPGVVYPADPVHGARIALCLQDSDWPVTMLADGSLTFVGQLTVSGEGEFQADLARCEEESGRR